MLDIPIIEVLKPYKEQLNAKYILNLPANSDYGNLTLLWMELICRFECVNDLIISLYTEFDIMKNNHLGYYTDNQVHRQKFQTEQIFYWLRKSADEVISLLWVLAHFKRNNHYSSQIEIDSIGKFINNPQALEGDLINHIATLRILNDVSNGFKHSFVNSQIHNHHGSDYPVVFAYTLKYNNLSNQAKFYTLDLRRVLEDYSIFLMEAKAILKSKHDAKSV
jgi:hypothetical protein